MSPTTLPRHRDVARDIRRTAPCELTEEHRRLVERLVGIPLDGDQAVGGSIIRKVIKEPLRWIATNAGQEGSIVVQTVKDAKGEDGYNAGTDTYENLVKSGVIDAVKVVRTALQYASSVASRLPTTEALVSETPEEKKDTAGAGGGMPGGGMGVMYQEVRRWKFELARSNFSLLTSDPLQVGR